MRTRSLLAAVASILLACGGGDDPAPEADPGAETGGDEAPETGGDETAEGDGEGDAAEEEEDGMSCVPVSRCHSFANQGCALVDADGAIQGEEFSAGSVERACPGEREVADTVQECFDYVEMSDGCRRRPEIRQPEWPCGRTDTARCGLVM